MKKYDMKCMSQISVANGKRLITSRNLKEEMQDPYFRVCEHASLVRNDLRHFGRCQRITVIDYTGHDYTQDVDIRRAGGAVAEMQLPVPHVFIDMKLAPLIQLVDLSRFDRKPGCIIRIMPKKPVRFVNVTVRVCDLYNRELVHDHAWDEDDLQEWIFSYFPQHKFNPDPGNLRITICASEKPRESKEAAVDVYELPPEKLRKLGLCLN